MKPAHNTPKIPHLDLDEVVRFIQAHTEERGYPPSRREIGRRFGLDSSSTAQGLIVKLIRQGLIEVDEGISRGIRVKGSVMKARTEEFG